MMNIKLTKAQLSNARELFAMTDRVRKYISDSVVASEDPDTGEAIQLYFEGNDNIRMEVYRRNRWIMECTYSRTGDISEFKPTKRW